jgi:hypothetical protein
LDIYPGTESPSLEQNFLAAVSTRDYHRKKNTQGVTGSNYQGPSGITQKYNFETNFYQIFQLV